MKLVSLFFLLTVTLKLMGQGQTTEVSSNEAYYDGETILLVGNVEVENSLGKIIGEKAVLKRDEKKTAKLDFPWAELSKNVILTLPNGQMIKCEHVFFDYINKTSTFNGSPQVIFSDSNHEILADEAHIDYVEKDGSLKPQKIVLIKSVRMSNLGSNEKPEEQYAIADKVTYFPDEELMILEGKENKVLFYDKKRDMQLSAKTVHATRNKETKKEAIQGKGDVRFVFGHDELEKMRNRFRWEDQ